MSEERTELYNKAQNILKMCIYNGHMHQVFYIILQLVLQGSFKRITQRYKKSELRHKKRYRRSIRRYKRSRRINVVEQQKMKRIKELMK